MGCIRVDKITEYLCEPLRKCLKDEDPYVRKTAAVCVAKLHDINAQLVEDQGFLDSLRDLLSDSNPMVSIHVHTIDWTSTVLKPVIFTCTSKSSSSLLRKWAVSISFLWYPKMNCIPISLVTMWYLMLFEKVNFFLSLIDSSWIPWQRVIDTLIFEITMYYFIRKQCLSKGSNFIIIIIIFCFVLAIVLRAVTKISSCHLNTSNRQGIKQPGISFGSIFLLFSYESPAF